MKNDTNFAVKHHSKYQPIFRSLSPEFPPILADTDIFIFCMKILIKSFKAKYGNKGLFCNISSPFNLFLFYHV